MPLSSSRVPPSLPPDGGNPVQGTLPHAGNKEGLGTIIVSFRNQYTRERGEIFMIIVMRAGASTRDTRAVIRKIRDLGYTPHTIYGKTRNVIGAIGDERGKFVLHSLESLPGVERVVPILKPYKLASREVKPEPTEIRLAPGVSVGGKKLLVIAGPCSVESEQQMVETANAVKAAGAHVLRGGAFKPRTSPYAFPGLAGGGAPRRDRGDEPDGRRPGRPVLRHPAGGSPQRPELLPPEADRKIEAADPAQAGNDDDHHRVPHERRILPLRGEPPGDPLRAGDPQ